MPRPTRALTLAALFAALLAGCGGGANTPAPASSADGLKELADVYRYRVSGGENLPPPGRLEDLNQHIDALPNAYPRIQSGEYVVCWGVGLGTGPDAAKTVLAYEKKAATEGGAVLLRDGTVKQMTAAEFQAAPKAKK